MDVDLGDFLYYAAMTMMASTSSEMPFCWLPRLLLQEMRAADGRRPRAKAENGRECLLVFFHAADAAARSPPRAR